MNQVWAVRAEGLELYFTMDAGPNLKLLFLQKDQAEVKRLFPKVQVVTPFG
jgi:diphosphomevalonate decarboxylase